MTRQGTLEILQFRTILAVASFAVYAAAVLFLRQDETNRWPVETSVAIPSAVSFVVYGTPIGTQAESIAVTFGDLYNPDKKMSVQEAIARSAHPEIPRGRILQKYDGIGAGSTILASVDMTLFGPKLSSLVIGFLMFIGISTAAFLWRFHDERMFVVPLVFLTITIMLLTPLATVQDIADQCPIGGNRYFVVGALLPAIHMFFELCDRTSPRSDAGRHYLAPLFIQAALLTLAIVVRSSIGYLVAIIFVGALATFYQNRRTHVSNEPLHRKVANSVIVAIVTASVLTALMPNYLNSGRTLGIFWHRAFISLSLHPDWPFGNLNELYPCRPDVPQGLTRGAGGDHIAHCVWDAYTRRLGRSIAEMDAGIHSGEYESVLRAAYWNAVSSYPWKAIELYTFYKPRMLGHTLLTALRVQFDRTNAPTWLFLIFQVATFVLFLVETYRSDRRALTHQTMVIFALSGVLSLLPGLVAWNVLATSVDTIFFMYVGAAIILTLVIDWIFATRQDPRLQAHALPAGNQTQHLG